MEAGTNATTRNHPFDRRNHMIQIRVTDFNEEGIEVSTWEQTVNLTMQEVVEWVKGKEGKE